MLPGAALFHLCGAADAPNRHKLAMHHLLAYLSIATALVAPQTRRQTPSTRRASSLEKFADMAKKGQERLYQYQEELFEKYPDKIGRPTPPPKKAKKLKKESTVADVMAKYGAAAARERGRYHGEATRHQLQASSP